MKVLFYEDNDSDNELDITVISEEARPARACADLVHVAGRSASESQLRISPGTSWRHVFSRECACACAQGGLENLNITAEEMEEACLVPPAAHRRHFMNERTAAVGISELLTVKNLVQEREQALPHSVVPQKTRAFFYQVLQFEHSQISKHSRLALS